MKRLVLVAALLAALASPAVATAHPLGNFTINRHTTIELSGGRIYVHYALDLAEIPTFQLGAAARRPAFALEAGRRLELLVDGRRARLRLMARRVVERPGAGRLDTLRLDAVYEADRVGSRLVFHDLNLPSRIGWREVVVRADHGARVDAASVPSASRSDELRSYPGDLLRSPLDVRSATARVTLGEGPGTPPRIESGRALDRPRNAFEGLASKELSLGVIVVSLGVALFWGAAHALTPGHGKAIVAAYLVGTRGTAGHALLLGAIVTITHTIGVFALGLVTLALSELLVPEQLYPWLNLVSALLVVGVGVTVLRARVLAWRTRRSPRAHHHHHHHHHHHGPGGHVHAHAPRGGTKGLVAVGISGGLLPCPTALVVLLAAISLHRVGYGLLLIFAFSVGLASVITGIGLLSIGARQVFARVSLEGPVVRALPAVSAVVIVALGLAMTVRALPAVA